MNTLVKYDRRHDRLSIVGNPGATQDIFRLMERLQIDPQHSSDTDDLPHLAA